MNADIEDRMRSSLQRAQLPLAPDHLRSRAAAAMETKATDELRPIQQRRTSRSRPWLLLPAAAILVALVGVTLLIPGAPLPTVVDGLPVMTVSAVLDARAAGGLRNQPVAVGGYWSYDDVALFCQFGVPLGSLLLSCEDRLRGITERDEPVFLIGTHGETLWQAQGPHLYPYFAADTAEVDKLFEMAPGGAPYPPVPIVVVGHFDDPRAALCHAREQECADRLVVDRVAYYNRNLAQWPAGIPTPEPTDPLSN